jgi:two-component system cell cycle response regulator
VQEEAPDLILLDVLMPDLNGYEVTKRLKNDPRTRNIPIILLTALNGPEDKTKGLKAGADDFLNKPVHSAELLTRVRSFLRLKEYEEKIETTARFQESSMETTMAAWENAKKEDVASILFVADNEKDDGLIQSCQDDQKCKISRARDGKEALSLISQEEMDLLILNAPLPGTDAIDLCRRLKDLEKTKNIQIMIVTSQKYLASMVKMMELGADDFMVKPVDKNEFKTRIEILLKKKKAADCLSVTSPPTQTIVSGTINETL